MMTYDKSKDMGQRPKQNAIVVGLLRTLRSPVEYTEEKSKADWLYENGKLSTSDLQVITLSFQVSASTAAPDKVGDIQMARSHVKSILSDIVSQP